MKKTILKILSVALPIGTGLLLSSASHAGWFGNEVKVQWENVPAVVQKAITAHAENGKVDEVEKEVKANKASYEARVKTPDGQRLKLKVAEDGTLMELRYKGEKEIEIPWGKVPPNVQKIITENADGGKVEKDEVEKDIRGGRVIYEAKAITSDKKEIKMKVAEDGKLLEFKRKED